MSPRECSATWRSTAWWDWYHWQAMRLTCCFAPICATSGYYGAGWTSSRARTASSRRPDVISITLNGPGRLFVRLGVGCHRLRRARTALQREILALIQRANADLIEAGLVDLQVGAVQRIRRQFLDRETNCFRRGAKSPLGEARPLFLADGGRKQFGSSVEAKGIHGRGPLFFLVRTRTTSRTGRTGAKIGRRAGTRHFISDSP